MTKCDVFLCDNEPTGRLALALSERSPHVEHLICDFHRDRIAHGFKWASAGDTPRVLFIGEQVDDVN